MPEWEQPQKKRQAVIVGINRYKDHGIPILTGAENDAIEIYERLRNPDIGNFRVSKDHFLIDDHATNKAVRKAISDLLWKSDEPCDLALFYFSGHGFVDVYGNGYLAPYDMLKDKPYVSGINMQELKQVVLDSKNKSNVLVILDCCYNGISTKGKVKEPLDLFFLNLNEEAGGHGKYILASNEGDKISNEIHDCMHGNRSERHSHGIFSYYLIEGLDGPASDDNGIIYFDKLLNYVENRLIAKGKKKPKFFAGEFNKIDYIKIAVAIEKFYESIKKKIKKAESYYANSDIASLIQATKTIKDVLNIDAKNENALILKDKITTALKEYCEQVNLWLIMNEIDVHPFIPNIYPKFKDLVDHLHFDNITELDREQMQLIIILCKVSKGEIDNNKFIKYCNQFKVPSKINKSSSQTKSKLDS